MSNSVLVQTVDDLGEFDAAPVALDRRPYSHRIQESPVIGGASKRFLSAAIRLPG